MLKNKKILFIILFTFSLLFINSAFTEANASTYHVKSPISEKEYDLPEYSYANDYPYQMIYSMSSSSEDVFVLVYGTEPFNVKEIYNNPGHYEYENAKSRVSISEPFIEWGGGVRNDFTLNDIVYSNFDVMNDKGDLVFQAPVPVPEITKNLAEELKKAEVEEKLKQMIAGFLKYLLAFLISLIAFWKGWKFLSTQLRKA